MSSLQSWSALFRIVSPLQQLSELCSSTNLKTDFLQLKLCPFYSEAYWPSVGTEEVSCLSLIGQSTKMSTIYSVDSVYLRFFNEDGLMT